MSGGGRGDGVGLRSRCRRAGLAALPPCLDGRGAGSAGIPRTDYFARLLNGTGVVADVRPEDLVDEATAEVFAFTARVCEASTPPNTRTNSPR